MLKAFLGRSIVEKLFRLILLRICIKFLLLRVKDTQDCAKKKYAIFFNFNRRKVFLYLSAQITKAFRRA